jgi:mRNA-degrading endonuclease RelE of RelBE toxin-antitoxin system
MWDIKEHKRISKTISKLPPQVVRKYEIWKDLIFRHGPEKVREFPGFHDEKLMGDREGQRSSRLNLLYRVIYEIEEECVTVYVVEIIPHS